MTKEERYLSLIPSLEALVKGTSDSVSIYANASAALHDTFGFFWVGFYLVKGENLILGPFQGSVACTVIAKGKGVCGTAWKRAETIVVPDVEKFPGHIACSSLSRSEIVVPLLAAAEAGRPSEVVAVLDIDSDQLGTFDEVDRRYLEKVAQIIAGQLSKI